MVAITSRRRRGAVALALMAAAAPLWLRTQTEPWGWAVAEGAILAVVTALAAWYFAGERRRRDRPIQAIDGAVVAGVLLLPLAVQGIARSLGSGAAWELVALGALAAAAVALASTARRSRTLGLSVACSGFLVLFTTAASDDSRAVLFALLWTACCLGWLVANHWERLEGCLVATVHRQRPARGIALVMAVVMMLGTAWLTWSHGPDSIRFSGGVLPTSGGERWSDPQARSGVGDGDALVAARDHAAAFGAVETDVFLESDQPSLFDMYSDTMGQPIKVQRYERAIALRGPSQEDSHARVAESQQSSPTFSTARHPTQHRHGLKDRRTGDLAHWVGRRGIRLAVERFTEFDGVDWRAASESSGPSAPWAPIRRETSDRLWWFLPETAPIGLLVGGRAEAIKFINLRTSRIPAPAQLAGWHIDRVDRDDFFGLAADGTLEMTARESIPESTIVRLVNREVDRRQLYTVQPSRPGGWGDSACPRPATAGIEAAARTAREATAGIAPGWRQVDAIVQCLRSDFTLDRTASLDPEDPLHDFFTHRRGGPHLFATAAAAMLRELGYSARFVTGFYVDPGKYDRLAGQTPIQSDDVHAWVEVRWSEGLWLPIEPTPGYQPPPLYEPWYARLGAAVVHCRGPLLATLFLAAGAWWGRRRLVDAMVWSLWMLSAPWTARRRLAWWVSLLDWRGRIAHHRRPPGVVPRHWFVDACGAIDPQLAREAAAAFDGADRLFFGAPSDAAGGQHRMAAAADVQAAGRVIGQLTAHRMNRLARAGHRLQRHSPEGPTTRCM